MGKILPSEIQRWVTTASATEDGNGLSAASVRKYHTMLHSVFERALRDRVVTFNPCAHTELPKVIKKKTRTLNPEEYVAILASLPAQHRLLVETAINTGLRWGELIALKPRHLDLIKRTLSVEETVVEVSIKNSPTGSLLGAWVRMICCSPPARAPPSRGTPSAPGSGGPPSRLPASTSTSASTICATRTPPGCWPGAPT
jgi:integrase